jgi:cyclopropane fatty-acyl-phospholipid synthase-like methyltransferase
MKTISFFDHSGSLDLFQKICSQGKMAGTFRKFLNHAEEQFRGIDLCGKSILEIGCGKGLISLWLALVKDVQDIVAIDEYEGVGEDKDNYRFFEEVIENNGLNIELIKMDFWNNNFKSDSFDIIVTNYALHHMVRTGKYIASDGLTREQWIALFSEIRRILKKQGVMILKEVTRFNLWRFLPLRFRFMDWEIHPTKKEFIYVIEEAGFENISVRNVVNHKLRYFSNVIKDSPAFSFFVNPDFYLIAKNV